MPTGNDANDLGIYVDSRAGQLAVWNGSADQSFGEFIDPEKPGAFQSLLAALDEAQESVALQVLGDSTGNDTDEWVYLTAQYLAARYPAYSVRYQLWNDTNQYFDAPVAIQTGTNGLQYAQFGGSPPTNSGRYVASTDITFPTSDWDVRVKVAPDLWISGAATDACFVARFNNAGQRCFRFNMDRTNGKLLWNYSTDGTTLVTATSTLAPSGVTNGAIKWLRVVHVMNNGAAGTDVKFYTGDDGVTWTQLGTTVTVATALTTLFNPGTNAQWEIGARSVNAETLAGKIYEVDILNGVNGAPLAPQNIDAWLARDTTSTIVGAPTLQIVNASKSGADITYLSDSTRLPKMTPDFGQCAVLLSCSHNDGGSIGSTYLALWDTWLTRIRARLPLAGVIVLSQNPRTSPATFLREHIMRRRQLMVWAQKNTLGFLDIFRAFRKDGRAISTLVDPADGIHPTSPSGRLVWSQAVQVAMTRRQ